MLALDLSLESAAWLAPAFNPASLFGAAEAGGWYDPSDLSSMFQLSNGTTAAVVDSPVGYIADKSGNGNTAIQDTAAARPILRQDANGKYYLEFDGVDDALQASFAISQPWDRLSAIQQISWTLNENIFGGAEANAGTLVQANTTPKLMISDGSLACETDGATVGVNVVVTERHNNASSRLAVNSGAYTTGTTGTTLPGGIRLGSRYAGISFTNARIYGVVMIARALSDGEITQLRSYLASQSGVTL